jgi:hypothetical protein
VASIRQPSFSGGELSPLLQGRMDLAKYATGLKKARNFFISKHGSAVSRPGTTFVAEVKNSAKRVRLARFVFSDEQSFLLEFGDTYIRFYHDGGRVESSPGVAYEVTTAYAEADLPELKFDQAGDVITIAHSSYPPAELRRVTNTHWTFGDIDFAAPDEAAVAGDTFTCSYSLPAAPAVWSNATAYVLGDVVARLGKAYFCLFGNTGHPPELHLDEWVYAGQATGREWEWALTGLIQIGNVVVESAPVVHAPGLAVPLSQDYPAILTVATGAGAGSGATQYQLWGVNIYRGIGGVWGLVNTMTNVGDFTDVGEEPDYTKAPPQSANPFTLYVPGAGPSFFGRTVLPAASVEYPACVATFEQRKWYADTASKPAGMLASETNNYYRFDDVLIPIATSAMRWELASRELAQIRSMVPLQKLLAFTNSGVWATGGAGGGPVTFDSIDCKLQTELGASWLTPIVVEDSVLYARAKGTGVRELVYSLAQQKFSVGDTSVYSEHLFTGHQVVDWAYAEDPWQQVWAVLDSGRLLSLSYSPTQEQRAWAWHDTDGTFENVCSVPEGTEDGVYVVVKRTINSTTKRYIERMTNRVFDEDTATDDVDIVCLDAALTYSGSETTTISGLSHLEAKDVYGLADGGAVGPFTVAGGEVTLLEAASNVVLGLKYTPELELLPPAVAGAELRSRQKSVRRVTLDVYASRGFQAGPDFDHLVEHRQRVVGDGLEPLPLETGAIQMDTQSSWDADAGLCIRQDSPLPLTVTGVLREVEFGED